MTEFHYSHQLDTASLEESGSFTTLPVRIYQDNKSVALKTSRRFLKEWAAASGEKLDEVIRRSGQCPFGHWALLGLPECIPGRLSLMAKIIDYICLENDLIESAGSLNKDVENKDVLQLGKSGLISTNPKIRRLQTELSIECYDRAPKQTNYILASVREYWSSRMKNPPNVTTFDEYIEHKIILGGWLLPFHAVLMAMDICLDSQEQEQVMPTIRPLIIVMALSNDYFSFNKEKDEDTLYANFFNAVSILSKHQGMSEEAALAYIKTRIIKEEENHYTALDGFLQNATVSVKLQQLITGLQLMTAGTHVWHAVSSRYNVPYRQGRGMAATKPSILRSTMTSVSEMLGMFYLSKITPLMKKLHFNSTS